MGNQESILRKSITKGSYMQTNFHMKKNKITRRSYITTCNCPTLIQTTSGSNFLDELQKREEQGKSKIKDISDLVND